MFLRSSIVKGSCHITLVAWAKQCSEVFDALLCFDILSCCKGLHNPLDKSLMEFLKKLWYKLTNSKHRKKFTYPFYFFKFHFKGYMKGNSNYPKFGLVTKCFTNIVRTPQFEKILKLKPWGENWIISTYSFQSTLLVCLMMKLRSFDKYEKTWKIVPWKNNVRHWNVHK